MKITKYGHCCMLVEEGSLRALIDPGVYNETPHVSADVLLITHEHPDHCHVESVQQILAENPSIEVITHAAVATILAQSGVRATVISDGETLVRNGVDITSSGHTHAHVHPNLPVCVNTGFFIGKKLFFPGDCFHIPKEKVDVLALPVSGPWMKLSEAIDYAVAVHPRVAFPVHDGMLKDNALGSSRAHPTAILTPLGIEFRDMRAGSVSEF